MFRGFIASGLGRPRDAGASLRPTRLPVAEGWFLVTRVVVYVGWETPLQSLQPKKARLKSPAESSKPYHLVLQSPYVLSL